MSLPREPDPCTCNCPRHGRAPDPVTTKNDVRLLRQAADSIGAGGWSGYATGLTDLADKVEQDLAERAYPRHASTTALANWRAGREVWDTNGDLR